jgi:intraflagellar transport protein 46
VVIPDRVQPARPDGLEERLGITTLDEPAATQSDATILELQLRAMSKKSGVEPMMVRLSILLIAALD